MGRRAVMRASGYHSHSTVSSCSSDLDHSIANMSTDSTALESESSSASSHSDERPQEPSMNKNHLHQQDRVQCLAQGGKEGEDVHHVSEHDLRAFALQCPQYVDWDPSPQVVVLRKNTSSAFFGFHYKMKICKVAPVEVFTLVEAVVEGGLAESHLAPGDWIRSLNGQPINSKKDIERSKLSKCRALRVIIQRPRGFTANGLAKLQDSKENSTPASPSLPPLSSSPPPPYVSLNRGQESVDRGPENVLESRPSLRNEERRRGRNCVGSPAWSFKDANSSPPRDGISLSRNGNYSPTDDFLLPRAAASSTHKSAGFSPSTERASPKTAKASPRTSNASPRTANASSRTANTSPRTANASPRTANASPQTANASPRTANDSPRTANVSSRTANASPRTANASPRTAKTSSMAASCSLGEAGWSLRDARPSFGVDSSLPQTTNSSSKSASLSSECSPEWHPLLEQQSEEEISLVTMSSTECSGQYHFEVEEFPAGAMLSAEHNLQNQPEMKEMYPPVMFCSERCLQSQSEVEEFSAHAFSSRGLPLQSQPEMKEVPPNALPSAERCPHDPSGEEEISLVSMSSTEYSGSFLPGVEDFSAHAMFSPGTCLQDQSEMKTASPDARAMFFTGPCLQNKPEIKEVTPLAVPPRRPCLQRQSEVEEISAHGLYCTGSCPQNQPEMEVPQDALFSAKHCPQDLVEEEEISLVSMSSTECSGPLLSAVEDFPANVMCSRGFRFQNQTETKEVSAPAMSFRGRCLQYQSEVQELSAHALACTGPCLQSQSEMKAMPPDALIPTERCPQNQSEQQEAPLLRPLTTGSACSGRPSVTRFASLGPSCSYCQCQRDFDAGETLLKTPVATDPRASDVESCNDVASSESDLFPAALSDVPLTALPWGVLKNVGVLLSVPMPVGHDWKSVAGAVGKTTLEILAYDTLSARKGELPGLFFLQDWMIMDNARHFLQVLSSLGRADVCRVILNYFKDHPPQL